MRAIISVVLLSVFITSCFGGKDKEDDKSLREWTEELSVENSVNCNKSSELNNDSEFKTVDDCVAESFEVYQPFTATYYERAPFFPTTYTVYLYDGYQLFFLSGYSCVENECINPIVRECINPSYNNADSEKIFQCDELIEA